MTDEEQFTLLFRQHYSKVLAFAARRTQEARAHDVVAETFAAAWRHLRTLPDDPGRCRRLPTGRFAAVEHELRGGV